MQMPLPSNPTRNCQLVAAISLFTAFAFPAFGAPPGEADHHALRSMLTTVTKAVNEDQLDLLEPLVSDQFCLTTSDQVTVTSIEAFKEHFHKVFKSGEYPVTGVTIQPEATIETIFVDDNNGYCYGTAKETYALKVGGTMDFTSHWTATVTKVEGKWKLSTVHAGIYFMENPIVDALTASFKWALIGGVVGGFFVGVILCWILRRKKQ